VVEVSRIDISQRELGVWGFMVEKEVNMVMSSFIVSISIEKIA
jgi:hypothetical protein